MQTKERWGGDAAFFSKPPLFLFLDRPNRVAKLSSSFSGGTGSLARRFSLKMDARIVGIALGCAVSPVVSGRADRGTTTAADVSSDNPGPASQQRDEVVASESWEEFEERCRSPAKAVRHIGVEAGVRFEQFFSHISFSRGTF